MIAATSQQGATPFIHFVSLRGNSLNKATSVRYTIQPRAGTVSKPVDVRYSMASLERRGYAVTGSGITTLPVFGLYAGYLNRISVEVQFTDTSKQTLESAIATATYVDPNGVYDHPLILRRRTPGSVLGFDFFAMKSGLGGPIVVDTDGEIRWVGTGVTNSYSTAFLANGFVVGDQISTRLSRLELDGSLSVASLISPTYTSFHHNIDLGKKGILIEVNAATNGIANIETIVAEVTGSGAVLKEWDLSALLGAYMRSLGDDPSTFIRAGADWFHTNAAVFDPRDDSIIVSSRENFVIKIDYQSGNIIWIFGDPTKYWYSFPSLRAKSLRLDAGGLYPIGQHAVSITSDGLLMLFNDGAPSFQQPTGAPTGESRAYSAVSAYTIDPATLTAREAWRFDYGQSILSDICSSAYEAAGNSLLVNYSVAENRTRARLVGLDSSRSVVFDIEYVSDLFPCAASWNALPIPFDNMIFAE